MLLPENGITFVTNNGKYNIQTTFMQKLPAILFTLACMVIFLPSLSAQPYQTSIGVRMGSANGLSFQQFLGRSNSAIEVLAVYRRGGPRTVALFSQHIPLGRNSDTYLLLGAGGHIGMNGLFHPEEFNKPVAGIDAQLGFMYSFYGSPFAISVELKPMVELWGTTAISGNNAGVTLRYTID